MKRIYDCVKYNLSPADYLTKTVW